jgi:hypothetical protein
LNQITETVPIKLSPVQQHRLTQAVDDVASLITEFAQPLMEQKTKPGLIEPVRVQTQETLPTQPTHISVQEGPAVTPQELLVRDISPEPYKCYQRCPGEKPKPIPCPPDAILKRFAMTGLGSTHMRNACWLSLGVLVAIPVIIGFLARGR